MMCRARRKRCVASLFHENAVAIFERMLRVYLLGENVRRKCLSMALRKRGPQEGTSPTIK